MALFSQGEKGMQSVRVLIFRPLIANSEDEQHTLLILPDVSAAHIPAHLRGISWAYFATTTTDDSLFRPYVRRIEADLGRIGYSLR